MDQERDILKIPGRRWQMLPAVQVLGKSAKTVDFLPWFGNLHPVIVVAQLIHNSSLMLYSNWSYAVMTTCRFYSSFLAFLILTTFEDIPISKFWHNLNSMIKFYLPWILEMESSMQNCHILELFEKKFLMCCTEWVWSDCQGSLFLLT